jgi:D-glycero-D-manno-heptose 1,7-bisphosphate phosphatase
MSELSNRVRRGCPEAPRLAKQAGEAPRPIAFLDRDGVVNADKGYVHLIEDFEWMPGAIEAIKFLNSRGYVVAVVTNQSGIGRGLYGEEEFMFLTLWMLEEIDSRGGHIDVVYYCPHHPESTDPEYMAACPARKPGPGMLERASEEFEIDRERSFLIGNRDSDIGAAQSFGISGYLYEDGDLSVLVREIVEG